MSIDTVRAELRRLGAGRLLKMAINQKESRCILIGLCPFYFKYQGNGFCVSELLREGYQVERIRKLQEELSQDDERLNISLTLFTSNDNPKSMP